AYRFATSPAAMKRDEIVSGGGDRTFGDTSWDPIWDIETSITEEGWFVEMRIPFSQLRYSEAEVQTWGLQVERKIRRHAEDTMWAFTPRSERGGVARFGHLVGIENIVQGKRLELLPYVGGRAEYTEIARNDGAQFANPYRSGSDYFGNAGLDLKYRVTSNVTLDATLNPDFGQVEVDPAVINLTAFETRFDEKRPFFIEGAEIFDFGTGGGGGSQLLYSRRIGRTPQGSIPGSAVYSDAPGSTTILGALKLTGKTPSGWSLGALNAVTGEESASYITGASEHGEAIVEPLTNYFTGRIRRDLRGGTAAIGLIGTAVHRDLSDTGLRSRLRSAAYSAGIDARADVADREWTLAAELSPSYIVGEPEVISSAQRSSARYMHRPDADHLELDPTATSMLGATGRFAVSKQAGDWQGGATLNGTTPGYEINDLGFQSAADRVNLSGDFGYDELDPGSVFRQWGADVSSRGTWNFGGERQAFEVTGSANGQLLSFHGFNARLSRQFESWDDRLTRGGPLAIAPAGWSGNVGLNTNSRLPVSVRTGLGFSEDDAGGWSRNANVNVSIRFKEIYEIQIGPEFRRSHNAAQYVTAIADPLATHTFDRRFVFAPIDQTTVGLQTRFNATFTPELSFELYAEPFLSSGDYGSLMEFAAPSSFEFNEYGSGSSTIDHDQQGRYVVDPDGAGPAAQFTVSNRDFNFRSLLGNAVLRYEWSPGSTVFLVWQQMRSERLVPLAGDTQLSRVGQFEFDRDTRALFGLKSDNILLVKVNYWLNP
ncbi:MAG: DUF5916 domain-containing protein, partial [Gemmatimonadota bacterium]